MVGDWRSLKPSLRPGDAAAAERGKRFSLQVRLGEGKASMDGGSFLLEKLGKVRESALHVNRLLEQALPFDLHFLTVR